MSSHLLYFLSSFLLTPYHLLLFAHHYLSPLSHAIPSFSSTLTPAPHTTSSSPLYYLSSIPIMPYHPLFFSRHLLSLFCVISFLFPITLLPYAISFPPVHPPSSLFHVFIPHHSLSHAILSSLLPITPSPYIISSIPSFYSTSPPFILCHLLFFISYQPLPLVSLPYLIFTCRSPLRASQLIPKVLS